MDAGRRVNIPSLTARPGWDTNRAGQCCKSHPDDSGSLLRAAPTTPSFRRHSLERRDTHLDGHTLVVEGDIKGCFDNIDHDVLLSVLGEKLHDNRFLRLLKYLLKAGYVEDWKYGRTLSGTPQGGVVSPILANVYLDRLDKYVETVLIPAHTRGKVRKVNPEWAALQRQTTAQEIGESPTGEDAASPDAAATVACYP